MPTERDDAFEAVRQLWAGRFQGVISTHSAAEPGYPFGSLVPYCLDRDALPILLFSHLAQHARNLEADPHCAFTLWEPVPGDIQQCQRLTCIGTCTPCGEADVGTIRRYLAYFPEARMYYERLNFRPYRLRPKRFHYNGGFAAARWLGNERVLRRSPLDSDAERTLSEALIRSHGSQLAALLTGATTEAPTPIRIAGIDPWGLDLGRGDRLRRLPFPRALTKAADIGTYLNTLTTAMEG
jgi:putative heme iron utilization protein